MNCRICNCELISKLNCTQNQLKSSNFICRICNNKRILEYRKKYSPIVGLWFWNYPYIINDKKSSRKCINKKNSIIKICTSCGIELNIENTYKYGLEHGSYICRVCRLEYCKTHRLKNREINLKKKREYKLKRKEIIFEQYKTRKTKIKFEVLNHYSNGTMQCACCGEKYIEFLSIDHVAGGGSKHRKKIKVGDFYFWLIKNNFPTGYRVLCMNCNSSIGFHGYCPHEREL